MNVDLRSRELHILGDKWEAVLAVDKPTIRLLFAKADPLLLYRLHGHTDECHSWDVLVNEDGISLWLDDAKLSEVARGRRGRQPVPRAREQAAQSANRDTHASDALRTLGPRSRSPSAGPHPGRVRRCIGGDG